MPVDLLTLDDRLTRLENRTKSNFFEIEKKFSELSEKEPAEGGQERVQELEDLVLLIQLENTKLKEKLGSQEVLASPAGDERVARLESELNELKSGGASAGTSISKESMDEINSKFESVRTEIENVKQATGKISPKDVDNSIARVNAARLELENSASKFRSIKADIEKGMEEKRGLIEKLDQAEVNVEKADAYFTKMRTAEEKMNAIAEKAESLNESIESKMRNEAEKIELIKHDIESRLAATEDKFKSRLEKLDSLIEGIDIKSQGVNEKIGELEDIAKGIADAASIKTAIEESAIRVASLERNVSAFSRNVSEIRKVKEDMEEELSIRGSLEKKIDDIASEISSLGKLAPQVEEESAARAALESRMQDISSEIAGIHRMKAELDKAVYAGIEEVEKRLHSKELESRMQALSGSVSDVSSKMDSMKSELTASVDEQLADFDRKIVLLEQGVESMKEPLANAKSELDRVAQEKVNEFSADMDEVKGSLHLEEMRGMRNEIAEHRKVIQNLKADLEIAAARFFTNNLEEFARALDRKFPGFVSKEEYARTMQEISQRLKTIEAPDLSPLASRVELAEKKLEDVHDMMQNLAQSMPIVVE